MPRDRAPEGVNWQAKFDDLHRQHVAMLRDRDDLRAKVDAGAQRPSTAEWISAFARCLEIRSALPAFHPVGAGDAIAVYLHSCLVGGSTPEQAVERFAEGSPANDPRAPQTEAEARDHLIRSLFGGRNRSKVHAALSPRDVKALRVLLTTPLPAADPEAR
jgi:hypothetical protein